MDRGLIILLILAALFQAGVSKPKLREIADLLLESAGIDEIIDALIP